MQEDTFYNLTPHLVLDALEAAGFDPMGVCAPMNSLENRVYRISLDQDKALVAKFYRPGRWSREQIMEEHEFAEELQNDELPVAPPLMLKSGSTLQETEGIYFAVWELRGGRQNDEFDPMQLQTMGRLMARIHNIAEEKNFSFRPELNTQRYLRDPQQYLEETGLLDSMLQQRYRNALDQLEDLYLEKSRDIPVHRIHGDCHIGNILFRDQQVFILDFDDCLTGPAVQDLWMLTGGRDQWFQNRQYIAEGYRTFRDFYDSWWDLSDLLRGLRMVHYTGWLARRRDDPAFRPYFSHFGTRDFWEQETLALELLLQEYTS